MSGCWTKVDRGFSFGFLVTVSFLVSLCSRTWLVKERAHKVVTAVSSYPHGQRREDVGRLCLARGRPCRPVNETQGQQLEVRGRQSSSRYVEACLSRGSCLKEERALGDSGVSGVGDVQAAGECEAGVRPWWGPPPCGC